MLSFFRWVLFFIALLVTVIGGGAVARPSDAGGAGAAREDQDASLIPRGAGPSTMAKVLTGRGRDLPSAAVPRRADGRSQPQADQGGRIRDAGAHLDGGAGRPAAVGQGGAAPPHHPRGRHHGRDRRAGAQDRGADAATSPSTSRKATCCRRPTSIRATTRATACCCA